MKKLSFILLAVCLILSFAACGEKKEDKTTKEDPTKKESAESDAAVTGEEYDTGNFKLTVPSGWKYFPQQKIGSNDPNDIDPNRLQLIKGATTDKDAFSKPTLTIIYSGASATQVSPRDFYDNAEDMEDIVTGDHKWTAFRGTARYSEYKMIELFEDQGKIQYQVSMCYDTGNEKIDVNDADVQAILASIQTTNADDIKAAAEEN